MLFISKKKLLSKLYKDIEVVNKTIECDEKFIKLEESRDKEFGTNLVDTSEIITITKTSLQRYKREKQYIEELIKFVKES